MSSESDSDVFFDAEDNTPIRTNRSKIKDENSKQVLSPSDSKRNESGAKSSTTGDVHLSVLKVNENDLKETERKAKDNEKRRKKVEELRKQMLNDDDEILEVHSEQSSIASSFEGIYPQRNFIVPRKTDTNSDEIHSVISLGKIGSILGGRDHIRSTGKEVDALSTDSKYSTDDKTNMRECGNGSLVPKPKCLEPDVVASTKGEQYPVPPPRKKKNKKAQPTATTCTKLNDAGDLPSPTDPVESLAREFEYSLDLHSATKGQYVVKPQDREQDRAEGPKSGNIATMPLRSESLNSISSKSSQLAPNVTPESTKKASDDSPYIVRTRSDSGRPLTDQEILAQVTVRNLDTGEQIPLSLAEEHLPKCLNPLSLHIMRLTSEYVSNTALDKERESDEESIDIRKPDGMDSSKAWTRTRDIRRRLKMEVNRIKTVVDRVTHPRHGEEEGSEDEVVSDLRSSLKIKISSKLKSAEKGSSEFDSICVVQELGGEHTGAVWTMKFSSCGRLLATAGQDHDLRIWVLKDAYKYFNDMRQKFSKNEEGKSSPTPSQDSASLHTATPEEFEATDNKGPFMNKPFCRYKGHTAELLDVSWSKNYFILSSSMDKTVRLWHISRQECLCCFQHIDFVTAIAFHPRDDRYFLSGSLDGKLRLWNIPDKKVTLWNELDGQTKLITAVNFCQNGKIAVVGSYDGRCIFYTTDQLKYHTQIHVRSTKGKNAQGRKISGIEAMPGEDKILVTSNDSRIRLYDLRDLSLTCKFKGYANLSSQIKASFSHDGKYIISGSENQFIYIWKTSHDCTKFRRDRNDYWTGIKAHNAVVTSAVFAPNPVQFLQQLEKEQDEDSKVIGDHITNNCYVMVSADFSGIIKVFLHKTKTGATNVS